LTSPLTKAKNLEQKAAIEAKFNMEKPAVESGGDDEEDEAHSKKALLLLKPFIADESVMNEFIIRACAVAFHFTPSRVGSCGDASHTTDHFLLVVLAFTSFHHQSLYTHAHSPFLLP
jgi:hypothetical protein